MGVNERMLDVLGTDERLPFRAMKKQGMDSIEVLYNSVKSELQVLYNSVKVCILSLTSVVCIYHHSYNHVTYGGMASLSDY